MRMKLGVVLAALAAASLARGQVENPKDPTGLTSANYARLRDLVKVKPDELGWQQIAWHDSFFDGVVAAQAQDQPIFYWLYFGDPRGGC